MINHHAEIVDRMSSDGHPLLKEVDAGFASGTSSDVKGNRTLKGIFLDQ